MMLQDWKLKLIDYKMFIKIRRLTVIIKVFFKYRLYKFFKINNPSNLYELNYKSELAKNFVLALEELGPIFIKFGQLLSTRHELFPLDFIKELSKLQDQVKPFDNEIAKKIFKLDFKKDITEIFTDYSSNPIASASVAQVYTARLLDEEVIIKILRPDLKQFVDKDIRLLKSIIKILLKIQPDLKRFKPDELIIELERVLIDEQDLLREAANASQLRRNFNANDLLYIPRIYWQYCSKNILVMEKITGISINNIAELKRLNVDLKLLAKRGLEIFFTQVFEHCLFHGDLHPGNILVNAKDPKDPKFYAIDFGIMGSLGPSEQYYLASNLFAFLNRDYRRVAELHIESGWVDKDTRVDLFESAIRTVSEPILEQPISQISFGELLVKLFDVAKSFNMQLQPQLLIFKKSLINVEGIAHQLDPDLDIWTESKPYIEKWMRNNIGVNNIFNKIKTTIPGITKIIKDAPDLVSLLLNR